MNMEHLLAATNKVVELHNENVQLHTELAEAIESREFQLKLNVELNEREKQTHTELIAVTEQRDALAVALRDVMNCGDSSSMYQIAKQALATLTP